MELVVYVVIMIKYLLQVPIRDGNLHEKEKYEY